MWMGLKNPDDMSSSRHSTPEEFENVTFFLLLGLLYTLIRHQNALLTGDIFKQWLFAEETTFHLKTELIENDDVNQSFI